MNCQAKNFKVIISMASFDYLKYVVIVKELKFDSIRQQTYWVITNVKEYRTLNHAKAFASRFGVDVEYFIFNKIKR